jgi:hypothetical protein
MTLGIQPTTFRLVAYSQRLTGISKFRIEDGGRKSLRNVDICQITLGHIAEDDIIEVTYSFYKFLSMNLGILIFCGILQVEATS